MFKIYLRLSVCQVGKCVLIQQFRVLALKIELVAHSVQEGECKRFRVFVLFDLFFEFSELDLVGFAGFVSEVAADLKNSFSGKDLSNTKSEL